METIEDENLKKNIIMSNKKVIIVTIIETRLSDDTCKKCGGETIPSKGYGNAYTKPSESGLETILPGKGNLINCQKCKDCGHSFVPENSVP